MCYNANKRESGTVGHDDITLTNDFSVANRLSGPLDSAVCARRTKSFTVSLWTLLKVGFPRCRIRADFEIFGRAPG